MHFLHSAMDHHEELSETKNGLAVDLKEAMNLPPPEMRGSLDSRLKAQGKAKRPSIISSGTQTLSDPN